MILRARTLAASLGLVLLSACTSTTETTVETAVVTSLLVDPKAFMGAVPCSRAAGAARSYVATILEVSDGVIAAAGISSPPNPCSQTAAFTKVTVGKSYGVAVDVFAEAAAELAPAEGRWSGQRAMLVASTGATAVPRWTATCPEAGGALMLDGVAVRVRDCSPLAEGGSHPATTIEVDPMSAMAGLLCAGAAGGAVNRFDVRPADPQLAPLTGLGCGAGTASFTTGLQPDHRYAFTLEAFSSDPSWPRHLATCVATARAGQTSFAWCNPLSPASGGNP